MLIQYVLLQKQISFAKICVLAYSYCNRTNYTNILQINSSNCFSNKNMDLDIIKYYNNLDYVKLKSNKHETLSAIIKNTELKDENLSSRCANVISIITNNLHLFQSICNHPDIPSAIIRYLNYYPTDMCQPYSEIDKQKIWTLILTLLNFCAKPDIQNFLETFLIQKSSADNQIYRDYKNILPYQIMEIILLESTDFYALVKALKISDNYRYLNKIWVQHVIKGDFLLFKEKYLKKFTYAVCIFNFMTELLTPPVFHKINITSIWSEDINAAKNLATLLDRNIILINTMDYYESLATMPYIEIFKVPLYKTFESDKNKYITSMIKPISGIKKTKIKFPCKLLFYDGKWQKPIKGNYWIHNKTSIANATIEDINKCVASALQGFEIWSTMSIKDRINIIQTFAFALKRIGKKTLSASMQQWVSTNFQRLKIIQYSRSITAVKCNKPKGIIILMEKKEEDLFDKLTQSIVIGNSVIVIYTKESCNLAHYCDMFSTSGIPPGVINLLSCEKIKLLNESYDNSSANKQICQFTMTKQIITISFM